jgi:hypothetical protein
MTPERWDQDNTATDDTDGALEGQELTENAGEGLTGAHEPLPPEGPVNGPELPPVTDASRRKGMRELLDEAYATIQAALAGPPDQEPVKKEEIEAWYEELSQIMLDDSDFKAGSWSDNAAAWDEMFTWSMELEGRRKLRREEATMVKWLQDGYDFVRDMSAIANREAEKQPGWKKKLQRVRDILTKRVNSGHLTAEQAEELLAGELPSELELPNFTSATTEEGRKIIQDTHHENRRIGAVKEWDRCCPEVTTGADGRELPKPLLRASLGIHKKPRSEKLRQIYGALYLNLFQRYEKGNFENLRMLTSIMAATLDCWANTTDMAKGYYHARVHKRSQKFLGYHITEEVDDPTAPGGKRPREVFGVYLVLPFGAQRAVIVFHRLVNSVVTIQRKHLGFRGIFFLDDRSGVHRSQREGMVFEMLYIRLYVLLGTYFSREKLRPLPLRLVEMLGFLICMSTMRIRIPEPKLVYIVETARDLLAAPQLSNRAVAQLAGMVISVGPALSLGPPLARALFDIMKGNAEWDDLFDNGEHFREVVGLILLSLARWNGTRYLSYRKGCRIGGDASDIGIGGGLHDPVTGEPSRLMKVTYTFTPEEVREIKLSKVSSLLREVVACYVVLKTAIRQVPHQVLHREVTYVTDNQGSKDDIHKGRSPTCTITTRWIRELRILCMENDIQLVVEWNSRDKIQLWDDHSKEEDGSEFVICPREIRKAWGALLKKERHQEPILDGMAGGGMYHQLPLFISRYLTLDCWAVNFFAAGPEMKKLQQECEGGAIYVNGPFGEMAAIAALITEFRLHTVLVFPAWYHAPWAPVVKALPRGAEDYIITRRDIYTPSPRVPERVRENLRKNGAAYDTVVAFIKWPEVQPTPASGGSRRSIPGPPPA